MTTKDFCACDHSLALFDALLDIDIECDKEHPDIWRIAQMARAAVNAHDKAQREHGKL